jgi:hypothetical protein
MDVVVVTTQRFPVAFGNASRDVADAPLPWVASWQPCEQWVAQQLVDNVTGRTRVEANGAGQTVQQPPRLLPTFWKDLRGQLAEARELALLGEQAVIAVVGFAFVDDAVLCCDHRIRRRRIF